MRNRIATAFAICITLTASTALAESIVLVAHGEAHEAAITSEYVESYEGDVVNQSLFVELEAHGAGGVRVPVYLLQHEHELRLGTIELNDDGFGELVLHREHVFAECEHRPCERVNEGDAILAGAGDRWIDAEFVLPDHE